MDKQYIAYFDSGTSNTRLYLLDEEYRVLYTQKKAVGSKDSAIHGNNRILIKGLRLLYTDMLKAMELSDRDIRDIYASGMITSAYGLVEVPHLVLPLTIEEFSESLHRHYEDQSFQREIVLIPGLKTLNEDFAFVNNVRGEEIEVIGAIEEARAICGKENIAFILPGSHTHVIYVRGNVLTGIVSNFTGELFHALSKETILAPVLNNIPDEPDSAMVKKGVENLKKYGFNRAIYIAHALRTFRQGTDKEWFSYAEGVINGGVRESLEYYCENLWPECDTVCLIADRFMYQVFNTIFYGSKIIKNVIGLPLSGDKSYGINGLKKIIN